MVVNDDNKFIFVHQYKHGGSSIERALGGRTWDHGNDLHTRLNKIPNWQDYFSFTFIRNPWDRIVSCYFYGNRYRPQNLTTDKFKEHIMKSNVILNKISIQRDRSDGCNFIGRFEYMQIDFDTICDLIGIPKQTLPHLVKSNHEHYSTYFTQEMIEKVEEISKGDISHFGFTFKESATKNIGLLK